jgi:N-acetyl sugar amidotransferase
MRIKLKYNELPESVKFCSKCVISNQRPQSTIEFKNQSSLSRKTIQFDDFGVCDACRFAKAKDKIDWHSRKNELHKLCDKFRSNKGWDVIVPGSGGKDSAFTAHILKYEFGMNPLTVTWAPHLYTEIGWENFQNWIHIGGFDNLLFTPNGKLHRFLTKNAFINLLHPFQPFIIGQKIIGPRVAEKFGIPLIMYGENQAEYGNNFSENLSPIMNKEFYTQDNLNEIYLGGLQIDQILKTRQFKFNDLEPYLPLETHVLANNQLEFHYLGYYLKWDPQECFYYASANTGFKPNSERTEGSYSKYSSLDDKIDPFHYYTTLIKFGLGRASYDAAQEIRNNKISREEGVQLVKQFDQEFPKKYFDDFLNYVSLDTGAFYETIEKHRNLNLWEFYSGAWKLKHPVWEN